MVANIFGFMGKRAHFIGIGGSSMSGLAGYLKQLGFEVTGSDRTSSHKTEHLEEAGIPVFIGHDPENVRGAAVIIYSAAIPPENPERSEAARLGIPQIERCDLLGQLMQGHPFAVGVSGTHGKTTTTSMLAQIFTLAGTDPTIHIGGELDFIGGSTRVGGKHDFIFEACEYHSSFLHFKPTVAVILNIDEDHLDYYRDIDDIEDAFAKYAALLPRDGWCIAWGDDFRARRVCENAACNHMTFGLGEQCTLRPGNLRYDELGRASFTAMLEGEPLGDFRLNVSSESNLLDALAAICASYIRGLDMAVVSEALSKFVGAHRRFELTGVTDGVRCYTDYAHNPAEIRNALEIASMQPHGALWAVWQPFTYSRTKTLFSQFLNAFDTADHLLITDIMGGREADPGDIRSDMLIGPLRERGVDAVLTPGFDDAEAYLRGHWSDGDIMISCSCGDIHLLNEQIARNGDTPPARAQGSTD